MKKFKLSLVLITVFITVFTIISLADDFPQETKTQSIYFSTEEDFLSKTDDGVQIISDGDLLNWIGTIYMKNSNLLQNFDEQNDLGLDAVDVINSDEKIVAFSTELDSTHHFFTAGDLLSTNGALITNVALLSKWQFPSGLTDLGLDAVQFKGEQERIMKFLEYVASRGWDYYKIKPFKLPEDLYEFDIDIWFSTEGTPLYPEKPLFLDGDLLSAKNGTIVAKNGDLLISPCPAGLPDRGVDFGLDAVLYTRINDQNPIYFSTEILFNHKETPFTDGDLLRKGSLSVLIQNETLIKQFNTFVDFLGLDAITYYEK